MDTVDARRAVCMKCGEEWSFDPDEHDGTPNQCHNPNCDAEKREIVERRTG